MKGRFRARAKTWDFGKSSKGNEQLAIEFEIVDGDAKGMRRTYYGSFTDDAYEITIKAMRACGWMGDDFEDLAGLDANEVELVIDEETFEGKVREKVKWVNKTGGLALKQTLGADEKKAFAARMRDRIKAFDAKNPEAKGDVPF